MSDSSSEAAAEGRQQGRGAMTAIIGVALQGGQVVALALALNLAAKLYPFALSLLEGGNVDMASIEAATRQLSFGIALAIGACVLGIGLVMYSAIRCRYRAPWFHKFLVGYGWCLILSPPLTPLGIWMVYYGKSRRQEFTAAAGKPG